MSGHSTNLKRELDEGTKSLQFALLLRDLATFLEDVGVLPPQDPLEGPPPHRTPPPGHPESAGSTGRRVMP